MQAALLAKVTGEPRNLPIQSNVDDYPAIDADSTVYLDDRRIFHGDAADRIEVETETVYLGQHSITTEQEKRTETAYGEWFADFDAGWIGVSNGDMEWLFDYLSVKHGVEVREGFVDLDGFAEYVSDHPTASAWQTGRKRTLDEDEESESVQIDYHDSARIEEARRGDNVQLGFTYRWDGSYVRGTITASGYVAMYKDMPESTFARWMADEVVPFLCTEGEIDHQADLDVDDARDDKSEEDEQADDQQTLEATEG